MRPSQRGTTKRERGYMDGREKKVTVEILTVAILSFICSGDLNWTKTATFQTTES